MVTNKDAMEFVARLAREISADPYSVMEFARLLIRAERVMGALNTLTANGYRSEAQEIAAVRKEERLAKRVKEACESLGIGVQFDCEPGGPAILLKVPSGYTDDFARRGMVVP